MIYSFGFVEVVLNGFIHVLGFAEEATYLFVSINFEIGELEELVAEFVDRVHVALQHRHFVREHCELGAFAGL